MACTGSRLKSSGVFNSQVATTLRDRPQLFKHSQGMRYTGALNTHHIGECLLLNLDVVSDLTVAHS